MSQDLIAEGACGLPRTCLDVLMNCGHSEETDRDVQTVILRCEPLFLDTPSMARLFPKQDSLDILRAALVADLIKHKEVWKSAR
jgi:hypothetical protein